ncbi:MAG: hypothetical protein ABIK83_14135 [Candidatus Zixiibacteriota bacterium]
MLRNFFTLGVMSLMFFSLIQSASGNEARYRALLGSPLSSDDRDSFVFPSRFGLYPSHISAFGAVDLYNKNVGGSLAFAYGKKFIGAVFVGIPPSVGVWTSTQKFQPLLDNRWMDLENPPSELNRFSTEKMWGTGIGLYGAVNLGSHCVGAGLTYVAYPKAEIGQSDGNVGHSQALFGYGYHSKKLTFDSTLGIDVFWIAEKERTFAAWSVGFVVRTRLNYSLYEWLNVGLEAKLNYTNENVAGHAQNVQCDISGCNTTEYTLENNRFRVSYGVKIGAAFVPHKNISIGLVWHAERTVPWASALSYYTQGYSDKDDGRPVFGPLMTIEYQPHSVFAIRASVRYLSNLLPTLTHWVDVTLGVGLRFAKRWNIDLFFRYVGWGFADVSGDTSMTRGPIGLGGSVGVNF